MSQPIKVDLCLFFWVNIILVVVLVRLPGSSCAVLLVNIQGYIPKIRFRLLHVALFLRLSSINKKIEVVLLGRSLYFIQLE
jgi:hypothetical protein